MCWPEVMRSRPGTQSGSPTCVEAAQTLRSASAASTSKNLEAEVAEEPRTLTRHLDMDAHRPSSHLTAILTTCPKHESYL